ncbi:MAG: sigma 54-interacting transcriptional regulator [Polyangiaceae bacterium]
MSEGHLHQPAHHEASTLQRPRIDPDDPGQLAYVLVAIEGPDAGKSFTIDSAEPQRVLLGQSESCGVRLADRLVSRRHAALELAPPRLRITDLGSTNGTFVDGVAVADGWLRGGEVVRVGETAFRVDRGLSPQTRPSSSADRFGRLLGASPAMRRLHPLLERLAAAALPLLIEGEAGTGKELCAEVIHEVGPRATGPFVVFDCAITAALAEAELFGSERTAGLIAGRPGAFERAHRGTLLLIDVDRMEPAIQARLVHSVERGEVLRLGATQAIGVDVRVMSTTRRDLDAEVAAGRFRDDLFHRLAVTRVELPPLARRQGDVGLLARHFWSISGGDPRALDPAMLAALDNESWPGNVRELETTIARRVALGDLAGVADGRADGAPPSSGPSPRDGMEAVLARELPFSAARQAMLAEFERRYVSRVLERHGGNVTRAAAASGLARRYFQVLNAKRRG